MEHTKIELTHDSKKRLQSKRLTIAIYTLAGVVALLVAFNEGIEVGYQKASFSFHGGENYYRIFGGNDDIPSVSGTTGISAPNGMMRKAAMMTTFGVNAQSLPAAHGALGKIIRADLGNNSFVIEGSNGVEEVVLLSTTTSIRGGADALTEDSLAVDGYVAVFGTPNDQGQIEARLIRLLPPPPVDSTGTQTIQIINK